MSGEAQPSGSALRKLVAQSQPSTATLIRESLYGLERNFSGNVNAGYVDSCATRSVSQSWHGVRIRCPARACVHSRAGRGWPSARRAGAAVRTGRAASW